MQTGFQQDKFAIALKDELQRGERVLWQARALPRIKKASLATFFFAIPWTAFALFWTAMAYWGINSSGGTGSVLDYAFPLFGVPFILIGVFMLSKPLLTRISAGMTLFAVTNERVLRLQVGKSVMSDSLDLVAIGSIKKTAKSDSSGLLLLTRADGNMQGAFELGQVADIHTADRELREARDRANEMESRS